MEGNLIMPMRGGSVMYRRWLYLQSLSSTEPDRAKVRSWRGRNFRPADQALTVARVASTQGLAAKQTVWVV
ncbi:hypothetical protein VTJ04DRAFT_10299 [Mycothermus thermophilus]|uniref:uncharacterized protein n=1 Tax=Humicola insolens TaxID=85995 RepID=UPI00374379BB